MAVIYAPKMDFVGRAVYDEVNFVVDDGLLRASLSGVSQVALGEFRVSQIIHDLTGDSTLTAGSLKADLVFDEGETPDPLTGQSALTAARPRNDDFRADLTGVGSVEVEPPRAALSGSGAMQATLTGGEGVVFASRDLSGSGAITATSQPNDHDVQAQPMTATAHLGVIGETEALLDPIALDGVGTLAASFEVLPGYDSRVTQLTAETYLYSRARKDLTFAARMYANGVLAESRKTVTAAATAAQTSSASTTPETLTVIPSGPHATQEPLQRTDAGYDALDLSASTRREQIAEPSVMGLTMDPIADQSANEGESFVAPASGTVGYSFVDTAGSPTGPGMAVESGYVYSTTIGSLHTFSWDAADITALATVAHSAGNSGSTSLHLRAASDHLFWCYDINSPDVTVWDVSDPSNPTEVATWASGAPNSFTNTAFDETKDLLAFNSVANDTVTLIDTSDPLNLAIVGSVTVESPRALAFDPARALLYVSSDDATTPALVVVDVSTPATPLVVGSVASVAADNSQSVVCDPDEMVVYVASITGDVLDAVDVSTPSAPALLSTFATIEEPRALALDTHNSLLHVLTGSATQSIAYVQALDVSNPASITETDRLLRNEFRSGRSLHYDLQTGVLLALGAQVQRITLTQVFS